MSTAGTTFEREMSVFLRAVEFRNPIERASVVAEACDGDAALRGAVDRLLAEHDRRDHRLDVSVVRDAFSNRPVTEAAPDAGEVGDHEAAGEDDEILSSYRLGEKLGEGGYGLVYVAEQLRPVRRRVALKVLRPGVETGETTARFEAERQALALMDHPNIARVFDAGTTADGRPFIAMELVRGVGLTTFCDRHSLDLRERLALFRDVCHAVQHAHQKGIVHRDLKPSNVLVAMVDGRPVPKVIDFGVVKTIGLRLTDRTLRTGWLGIVGTPTYMSPEQAEMSGAAVDTRSDVFSLGALLYELLAGATPIDGERLERAGLLEFRRRLLEEEPPRPSARFSDFAPAERRTIAARRRTEPGRLTNELRGDLDWVVMKALEKDPDRRYPTAAAVAEEVQRHLDGLPVSARPPSAWYRTSKFARRHRAALSAAAVVAAALIIGAVVSVHQATVARSALAAVRAAEAEARAAAAETDRSRAELETFVERLRRATDLLGEAQALSEAGDRAAALAAYDRATEVQPAYDPVWTERASFLARQGLWDRAAADFARALENDAPATGAEFLGVPQLFVLTGRYADYSAVATQIADADAGYEQTAMRGRLAGPLSRAEASALAGEAERLLRRNSSARPGAGTSPRPSHIPRGVTLYIAGWAHLRSGRAERAVELLERAAADRRWAEYEIVSPLLALAYQDAG
ncbi:MAG: serine/threonine-protein kinase, partial [Planctomycetota bacterium]